MQHASYSEYSRTVLEWKGKTDEVVILKRCVIEIDVIEIGVADWIIGLPLQY